MLSDVITVAFRSPYFVFLTPNSKEGPKGRIIIIIIIIIIMQRLTRRVSVIRMTNRRRLLIR